MLCDKTNGKRHSVHYCVKDALGRFAKHSGSYSLSAIASRDSYASFVLSNLPRASIAQ